MQVSRSLKPHLPKVVGLQKTQPNDVELETCSYNV